MEKNMLAVLQYDLTVPTCYLFTARFRKAAGVLDDLKVRTTTACHWPVHLHCRFLFGNAPDAFFLLDLVD
jgi:hypothetical protein